MGTRRGTAPGRDWLRRGSSMQSRSPAQTSLASWRVRVRIGILPAAYPATFGAMIGEDYGLPVVLLQRLAHWPTAGQQLATRLGETAVERPEPFKGDLHFGTRVDEVVVI